MAYSTVVKGDNPHSLIHNLALAAIEHGSHLGAELTPKAGSTPAASTGNYEAAVQAESLPELGKALMDQAMQYAEHFGFELAPHNDAGRATRVGEAPVDTPDVTYHREHPETGERLASVTVKSGEAIPAEILQRDVDVDELGEDEYDDQPELEVDDHPEFDAPAPAGEPDAA